MPNPLVFVDTETTGLYPHLGHEIWEWASIRIDNADQFTAEFCDNRLFFDSLSIRAHQRDIESLAMNLADPMALNISGIFDRHAHHRGDYHGLTTASDPSLAQMIAKETRGATWVGAVPGFDVNMVTKFLLDMNYTPGMWHYHLIDIECLVAGSLGEGVLDPPWKYKNLQTLVNPEIPILAEGVGKHSALGDAFIVMLLYFYLQGLEDLGRWRDVWDYVNAPYTSKVERSA